MCSCEDSYTTARARRAEAWSLYTAWFNVATANNVKTDYKTMFRAYPELLEAIRENKDIKVFLYARLRKATRAKMLAWRKCTGHGRYNAFASIFYAKTRVSPTFSRDFILECLGV
jgi:hypothetical protein